MKNVLIFILLLLILLGFASFFLLLKKEKEEEVEPPSTEAFIEKWLTNDNGTLATYIKRSENEDEDLVKGRETLSETVGLWMEYGLLKDDRILFEEAYQQLTDYFLEKDGFVHWKLTEKGVSEVSTNALVDDLRIIRALLEASEKWDESKYERTAVLISDYITRFNQYQNVLTDFYETKDKYARWIITLSYIEPAALKEMKSRNLVDDHVYKNTIGLLKDAPNSGPFFPKSYDVKNKKYLYDDSINIIDQALVAYYRAQSGYSTESFAKFIKKQISENGVVFGLYSKSTKKPIVDYESPAIYGWLIMYCLEADEEELAKVLYSRMTHYKVADSEYSGGYGVYYDDTHIFDNLVPMLAEKRLSKAGLID